MVKITVNGATGPLELKYTAKNFLSGPDSLTSVRQRRDRQEHQGEDDDSHVSSFALEGANDADSQGLNPDSTDGLSLDRDKRHGVWWQHGGQFLAPDLDRQVSN